MIVINLADKKEYEIEVTKFAKINDKNVGLDYLLENQSLVGSASASSSIDLVISYEDIS